MARVVNKKIICLFTLYSLSTGAIAAGLPIDFPNYLNPWSDIYEGKRFNWLDSDYTQRTDNDSIFGRTDKYYSNGLRVELLDMETDLFVFNEDENSVKSLACDNDGKERESSGKLACVGLIDAVRDGKEDEIVFLSRGFFFSHAMFTPTSIKKPVSQAGTYDRPYVGWAQFGVMSGVTNQNHSDYSTFSIGCLGSCSYAEEGQKWAHKELSPSSPTPQGWDTQVKNTVAVQFTRTRAFKSDIFLGASAFTHRYLSVDVGSVMNKVGAGISFLYAPLNELRDPECDHTPANRTGGGFPQSENMYVNADVGGGKKFRICSEGITGPYIFGNSHSQIVLTNALITSGVHTDAGSFYHEVAPFVLVNKLGAGYRGHSGWQLELAVHYSSPETTQKGFKLNDHEWGQVSFTIPNGGIGLGILATSIMYLGLAELNDEEDRQ